jgi:hypothetical protein
VGQDPREIERDIRATRDRLTSDVNALADRVDPRSFARRTAEEAKQKIMSAVQRTTGGPR